MRIGSATEKDWVAAADLIQDLEVGDIFEADAFVTLKCMFTYEKRKVIYKYGISLASVRLSDGADRRVWEARHFITHTCRCVNET